MVGIARGGSGGDDDAILYEQAFPLAIEGLFFGPNAPRLGSHLMRRRLYVGAYSWNDHRRSTGTVKWWKRYFMAGINFYEILSCLYAAFICDLK